MKEIEHFYRETKRHLAFALPIDAAFLTIPASARLMTLEAKRRKIPLSLIHVFVRLEGGIIPQTLKTEIAYLEAKGFSIGIVFDGQMTLKTAALLERHWLLYPKPSSLQTPFSDSRVFVGSASDERAAIVPAAPTGMTLTELIQRFPVSTEEPSDETSQS
jgi:hypothetical protein